MQGWIKLHREVRNNWLYEEKRVFSKFEAWVDLLLEVNHKENKFLLGNELVTVKRGETITSIRQLCDRWGWSNTKVKQFLSLLESDKMITVKSDTKKTVITIDKYEFYQCHDDEKTTQKHHENDTNTTQKHTNKNEKNDIKNEKKKDIKNNYAENVTLSESEYQKLIQSHGEEKVLRMIEILDNYKGANGKKYKSDYKAILNWVVDRVLKENGGSNGKHSGHYGRNPKESRDYGEEIARRSKRPGFIKSVSMSGVSGQGVSDIKD